MIASAPWKTVPFESGVMELTGGQPKVQKREYLTSGSLPVIDQGQEPIAGYTNDCEMGYKGPLPVVLFGDHTRIFKYVDFPFALGADGVKVLAPKRAFNPKFLFFYFQSVQIPSRGYSRHFKFLREVYLPCFPLSEQRRIVEILEQAEALRKKRVEADAKADRILDALFIRLFGDPATNPKGWLMSTLGNVTGVIHRYPTFYGQEYVESGVPVVRISDILPNHILSREIDQYAKVPESFSDKFPLTILESNDVVMAVRGDTTGKIGLVPNELHGSNISPNLIRISPNTNELNHYYLFSYMLLAVHNFKPYITDTAKKSITAKNLKSIPIFIPPMALQERFGGMVSSILQMNEHWLTSHSRIEKLFTILLHRAFCGELTATWREGHMKELLAEMREQTEYLAPHGAHNQRENTVQQESLF
jgi:type I restriction enzyme, S subunit